MWPRDAYVGQRVVYTDDGIPPLDYYGPVPQRYTIYTIGWVGIHEPTDEVLIDLIECPSPACENYDRGWVAVDFKPVDESRLDVFREMLKRPGVWNRDEDRKNVVRADAI